MKKLFLASLLILFNGCGLKVINPHRPDEKGTLMLDHETGKLVGTFTCTMVGGNGKRLYATGKSEAEARKEVLAKCQSETLISFCKDSKMSCDKN